MKRSSINSSFPYQYTNQDSRDQRVLVNMNKGTATQLGNPSSMVDQGRARNVVYNLDFFKPLEEDAVSKKSKFSRKSIRGGSRNKFLRFKDRLAEERERTKELLYHQEPEMAS